MKGGKEEEEREYMYMSSFIIPPLPPLGAVFLVTLFMLGLDLWGALVIISVVFMIIVHMGGVMMLAGINANAVSLVNLVMTVGIAVEFCSHIVRWFMMETGGRLERAHSALANMGSSVSSSNNDKKMWTLLLLLVSPSSLLLLFRLLVVSRVPSFLECLFYSLPSLSCLRFIISGCTYQWCV